ncbi:MAG: H4MPT-linked C1 transfer pathway protein, partial [Methylococcaceae bacterium]|nr:H4MPT-linked C1 transfer pathway protein [Methylococcaceae bacterium]
MNDLVGWDIGGAHLKAVAISASGEACAFQEPTPLWQGLDHLHRAITAIMAMASPAPDCRHAITMTGELADVFANRTEGVMRLTAAFTQHFPQQSIRVFTGQGGFLEAGSVTGEHVPRIASANWLATAQWAARLHPNGLLADVGSTTTDLIVLADGRPVSRGFTDAE